MESIKIRCSSLGDIMTEPRSGAGLSETAKTCIEHLFIMNKYNRSKNVINRYIEKGLAVEEDSITFYCLANNIFAIKNENTLSNDFITGTPDIILEDRIVDVKSSYDIFTFFNATRKLNNKYYWQVQGYMALTGKKKATLAYCLIDTPHLILDKEYRRLRFELGVIDDENPNYVKACMEIERQHTFSDIPISERIFEWHIDRNDADIERIYKKVEQCRIYYKTL